MFIETALSMVRIVCDLKRLHHRIDDYITTQLACVAAMFNILLDLYHDLHSDAHSMKMSIAEFAL